ncbi:ankyrin repeat-containing domain protein [Zopfochytrium polystomum]|nr:ankyrin repeat-containing domain protein [Zopfochytrium polystomum]
MHAAVVSTAISLRRPPVARWTRNGSSRRRARPPSCATSSTRTDPPSVRARPARQRGHRCTSPRRAGSSGSCDRWSHSARTSTRPKAGRTTAAVAAAVGGHLAIVEWLLAHGADADGGWKVGRLDVVELLLRRGYDGNATLKNGSMPLHAAAANGDPRVVETLLDAGADPDCRVGSVWVSNLLARCASKSVGNLMHSVSVLHQWLWCGTFSPLCASATPLIIAAALGHIDVVKLHQKQAKIPNSDRNITPLVAACIGGHASVAQYLLDEGADANGRAFEGLTPIFFAVFQKSDPDIAALLKERGADVSTSTDKGFSPLHLAAANEDPNGVEWLLRNSARVDAPWPENRTPLQLAVTFGRAGSAKALVRHGASLVAKSRNGATPLFAAVNREDVQLVMALAEGGANLCEMADFRAALQRAVRDGLFDMIR